eukprot:TRINITY_DN15415_c0_g1_i2.p1 TRINITY_DN15415_c0_g1~~TRINITY_DN15415_c0_g1_i2.p1  ORF type:complete len:714 (-),score=127.34 TRINITY_DN15415_c0_g1_i2:120-2261(-)
MAAADSMHGFQKQLNLVDALSGGTGTSYATSINEFQNILAQRQKQLCKQGLQAYIASEFADQALPEPPVRLPPGLPQAEPAYDWSAHAFVEACASMQSSYGAYGYPGYHHGMTDPLDFSYFEAATYMQSVYESIEAECVQQTQHKPGGNRGATKKKDGQSTWKSLPRVIAPGLIKDPHSLGLDDLDNADVELTLEQGDIAFLRKLETSPSFEEALKVASESVETLTPGGIIEALHLAARRLPAGNIFPEKGSSSSQVFSGSAHMDTLLNHLAKSVNEVVKPGLFCRLAWALGKFELRNSAVDELIEHVCKTAPSGLSKCTPQDLSNVLGGLAKLYPGICSVPKSSLKVVISDFANCVVALSTQRVQALTAQCVANTLWSVARLRLRSQDSQRFIAVCLEEMTTNRDLDTFTPQGLANALWALAEQSSGGTVDTATAAAMKTLCQCVAESALPRVDEFHSQELSMTAWAFAKLYGRGNAGKSRNQRVKRLVALSPKIDAFMMALSTEAQSRLMSGQLSSQSISNVAWALATLDLFGLNVTPAQRGAFMPARQFMLSAMAITERSLSEYSPQAVANLLWAAVRLDKVHQTCSEVKSFASACARDATLRMLDFTWRDLAGVAAAFSYCRLKSSEAVGFLVLLMGHATQHCHELTPQAMLNIAQAAVRIQVPLQYVKGLINAIDDTIARRGLVLNEVDTRQWEEVKAYCAPGGQTIE